VGVGSQVNGVFSRKSVSRTRFEPIAIGKAQNHLVLLYHQVRQAFGKYIRTAAGHVSLGGWIYLEGPGSGQDVVAVNSSDGRDIFFTAGSDEWQG
jgi:hypothetical protein